MTLSILGVFGLRLRLQNSWVHFLNKARSNWREAKPPLVEVVIVFVEGLHCLLGWSHRDSDFFPQLPLNGLEFLLLGFLDENILALYCAM